MPYSSVKVANRFKELSGGTLTPLQLIKLVYIAHGWSFAKFNRPLINEDVRAWQYGPVIPQLYRAMKRYKADPVRESLSDYDEAQISAEDAALIQAVYKTYGSYSGGQLSSLTHRPRSPWHQVWNSTGENGLITHEIIATHYKELDQGGKTNL